MTAPPLRALDMSPLCDAWAHCWKLLSPVKPRVSVTSPAFGRPGSFLITYLPSDVFCFSSMTSCSIFKPVTSVICLMTRPSISRPNEWPTKESRSRSDMSTAYLCRCLLADETCAAGELREPEHHELGRFDRRDSDLASDLSRVDALGRVGLAVAPDVVRLVRSEPKQRALAPLGHEERRDRASDARPERVVIRLEHHPLGAVEDRLLEVVEQPADIEVAPRRIAGQRACAPNSDATTRERANAVHPDRVQQLLFGPCQTRLQRDGAANHLVGRGLVHAARCVVARPHSGHVTGRWYVGVGAAGRVEDLDPRVVHRGVLRVVAGEVHPPLADLLRRQPRRWVDDRHPVAHQLAVRDHRELNGLHGLHVDHAT